MSYRIGPDLIERYEDEPDPCVYCPHCGSDMDWEHCDQCGGEGYSYHDCGEDCCACLYPEPNVRCDLCDGNGGWWWCWNSQCPSKKDERMK